MDQSELIGIEIGVIFAIQLLAFIISCVLETEKLFDFTGALTFFSVVIFAAVSQKELRGQEGTNYYGANVVTVFICIWALRLGTYLTYRALKRGDSRFDQVKSQPKIFFVYWFFQGVWIMITLLPSLIVIHKTNYESSESRKLACGVIGITLFVIGFILESFADCQLLAFLEKSSRNSKFLTTGVWAYIRYPNYLGEIMLWFGLYIFGCSFYDDAEFLLISCPIYLALQLIFVSGIRIQEQRREQKYRKDPEYLAYKNQTNCCCLDKLTRYMV
ncbi:MAG: hypothetical protein MHMPM18_002257 [Marteilia pararefringens]